LGIVVAITSGDKHFVAYGLLLGIGIAIFKSEKKLWSKE
jgi:hypothetical protein